MTSATILAALAAGFITYPGPSAPRTAVEARIDRGPIDELIVRCERGGAAIITYSKLERLYCGSRGRCAADMAQMIRRSCG